MTTVPQLPSQLAQGCPFSDCGMSLIHWPGRAEKYCALGHGIKDKGPKSFRPARKRRAVTVAACVVMLVLAAGESALGWPGAGLEITRSARPVHGSVQRAEVSLLPDVHPVILTQREIASLAISDRKIAKEVGGVEAAVPIAAGLDSFTPVAKDQVTASRQDVVVTRAPDFVGILRVPQVFQGLTQEDVSGAKDRGGHGLACRRKRGNDQRPEDHCSPDQRADHGVEAVPASELLQGSGGGCHDPRCVGRSLSRGKEAGTQKGGDFLRSGVGFHYGCDSITLAERWQVGVRHLAGLQCVPSSPVILRQIGGADEFDKSGGGHVPDYIPSRLGAAFWLLQDGSGDKGLGYDLLSLPSPLRAGKYWRLSLLLGSRSGGVSLTTDLWTEVYAGQAVTLTFGGAAVTEDLAVGEWIPGLVVTLRVGGATRNDNPGTDQGSRGAASWTFSDRLDAASHPVPLESYHKGARP